MNQAKAFLATLTVVGAVSAPLIALAIGLSSMSSGGQLSDLGDTASLANLWMVAAIVVGLAAVAQLMFRSVLDVRGRGFGAVSAVSLLRLQALTVAERSHFAFGPGPEGAVETPSLLQLPEWLRPIRTADFSEPEAPNGVEDGPEEPAEGTARSRALAISMMPAVKVEVAAYKGPTEIRQAERGDTWWTIATETLDEGERWAEIAALNVGRVQADGVEMTESTRIRAGYELLVPAVDEDEAES